MGRACSTNGDEDECIHDIVGKPEGKRPLQKKGVGGWTILKWILREIGGGGMDWIDLA
jgi:hypothetical protein